MKLQNLLLILLFLVFSFFELCYSVESSETTAKLTSSQIFFRKKMAKISGIIRQLGPLMAKESEFIKPNNVKKIQKQIDMLTTHFKNLQAHPEVQSLGLSVNRSVMVNELEETILQIKNDNLPWARARLSSALNLCVSCHVQSPGSHLYKFFPDTDLNKMKLKDFERAELYFISRDYDKAMEIYDRFLRNSRKTDDDEDILLALERQLNFFVRIEKSFQKGKEHFVKYQNDKIFNSRVMGEIGDWIKILSDKSLWDGFNPLTVKDAEMERFMKGFVADEDEGPIFSPTNSSLVFDLNLSSILLDYFNAKPDTALGGKILYWLAILEKKINDNVYVSTRNVYLMTCMEKFAKDPIAVDCFDAYLEDLEEQYLSNKIKEFPRPIKDKVEKLKLLIKKN